MAKAQKLIESFRDELLRWNRQINLVSRQETEDRLEGLFSQCRGGAEAVLAGCDLLSSSSDGPTRVYYFDLGSGGGLPGVIWHILFSDESNPVSEFEAVQTWLVEPREKRAWFLNRMNRIPSMDKFGVLHGRWGDVKIPSCDFSENPRNAPVVVVSLKALHLLDLEVLRGLMAVFSSYPVAFSLIIARYYPPDQSFDQNLISLLEIPAAGTEKAADGYSFRGLGGEVLSLGPAGKGLASLVLSSYRVTKPS